MTTNIFNSIIDYTSLTEKETREEIVELCKKAIQLKVKSVCVYPKWVKTAKNELKNSNVLVCTVISFPKGNNSTEEKLEETQQAINNGADEIDMVIDYQSVINMGKKFEGSTVYNYMFEELVSMSNLCHENNKTLKVIVESGLLTIRQVEILTEMCIDTECDFIKTSTGKVSVGVELDKIIKMYHTIKKYDTSEEKMKIKASGGVRTIKDIEMFFLYVDRFGMGFGSVDKVNGLESVKSDY